MEVGLEFRITAIDVAKCIQFHSLSVDLLPLSESMHLKTPVCRVGEIRLNCDWSSI
jgi:hypothetical protein